MIHEFDFTYLDCQECKEAEYCDQCGALIEEMLLRLESVSGVDVNLETGRLSMETEGSSVAEAVEILKEAGITVRTEGCNKDIVRRFVDDAARFQRSD